MVGGADRWDHSGDSGWQVDPGVVGCGLPWAAALGSACNEQCAF
jgi:hypothetical protein